MPQSHTWQPLSMCCQNSVRGWPASSLHQERTHAEWFSHSKYWVAARFVTEAFNTTRAVHTEDSQLKLQHIIQTIYHTYPYIPYRPSTAHGLDSYCIQARQTISAMLSIASTFYIAVTHSVTHTPCTSTCTHHTAFHNPLHTTNKPTKHICVSRGKMAQDVGMVWKCCGVIPI